MADRKFSELISSGTLDGSEIVAVTKSSATRRTTTQEIANLAPPSPIAMKDQGTDHDVTFVSAEDNTANRTLEWVLGNADRRITLEGDVTLPGGTMVTTTGAQTISGKTLATLIGSVQKLEGAGAVNTTTLTTMLETDDANALTLADGDEGQIKIVIMTTDGGDGTLTPTNFGNGTTITFDDPGEAVILQFLDGDWWALAVNGATVA
jgi:hypothetical protein